MAGLLEFLQAASNSAASNVSAPVDALAWLLRKAGIPVPEDAAGGSAWMEKQGLTRPVKQSGASLAGETVGLLTPIAAAAKGPQIAKGLLSAGDNLAAPRLLNPEKGAIVYHGSPHKFDKFDSSKIGTGEGAQAYGHGLYLAESPEVAGSYAKTLSNIGQDGYATAHLNAQNQVQRFNNDPEWAVEILTDTLSRVDPYQQKAIQATIDMVKSGAYKKPLPNPGSLYKVDLPDDAIAKMLDWDKPLSQQSAAVKSAFPTTMDGVRDFGRQARALRKQAQAIWDADPVKGAQLHREAVLLDARRVAVGREDMTGRELYGALMDALGDGASNLGAIGLPSAPQWNGKQAAQLLRQTGVPGTRFLDGISRGAGGGTSNYVVFPGEEGLLKILERNGAGL